MAKFEDHCRDCERILGSKCEDVNRWMDELFRQYGPRHRRHRHCWAGVRLALQLFGAVGAKAAVVHIVRDCGEVPSQRTYDETALGGGIVIAPEHTYSDGEAAQKSFAEAVSKEFERAAGIIGKDWQQ
jgi:hypothetical protein